MIFGLFLLFLIFITYQLLVKGYLFKGILAIAGWAFIYNALSACLWAKNGIVLSNYNISLAAIIPTILVMLAMVFTYSE